MDALKSRLAYLRVQRNALETEIAALETRLSELESFTSETDSLSRAKEKDLRNPESPTPIQTVSSEKFDFQLQFLNITKGSSLKEKHSLFIELFRGRSDLHAKRFQSAKTGNSGYAPVCENEFQRKYCTKGRTDVKRIRCVDCEHQKFPSISESEFQSHLLGDSLIGSDVLAAYAIDQDGLCNFVVADFDCKADKATSEEIDELRNAARAFMHVSSELDIPAYLERSRSGQGFHVWIFFQEHLPAKLARRLGTVILTQAMESSPEVNFDSYDRLIPHQDTIPKTGFGSLIALPLQGRAGKRGCSVFLDEELNPYPDQWVFLSRLKKVTKSMIEAILIRTNLENDLGTLYGSSEINDTSSKPWEKVRKETVLAKEDFGDNVEIVFANMVHIAKKQISSRACNRLIRLAAFPNPEFYEAQRMRLDTKGKPRVISTAEETIDYISLPRGTKDAALSLLRQSDAQFTLEERRTAGRSLKVTFKGKLRDEQAAAMKELLKHDNGVLSATTAFGKTVIAASLIAAKGTSTLVLVHNKNLLTQWRKSLESFLEIENEPPPYYTPTGRKRSTPKIGEFSGSRKITSGLVDIAMMQSLCRSGVANEMVKDYGLVIVDECHHVPSFSFEAVMKSVNAAYVYGLTATPKRKDGHQEIIFMQCGPIRYLVDARDQAKKRPFEQYVIPRFTTAVSSSFQDALNTTKLYGELATNERRNELIVNDVLTAIEVGKNPLVLTGLTDHVATLDQLIRRRFGNVIAITGKMSNVEKNKAQKRIQELSENERFVIVATGKYIGEGFDFARLDTLFLALPIAWEGTVAQYTGRLHRLYEGKVRVEVYDYVDVRIPVLERMYRKRLKAYKSVGYKTTSYGLGMSEEEIIFGVDDCKSAFLEDCGKALGQITICSQHLTHRAIKTCEDVFLKALSEGVAVTVATTSLESIPVSSRQARARAITLLEGYGIVVRQAKDSNQKFAIIDEKIVWYGGVNLLGSNDVDDAAIRIIESEVATALLETIS